MLGLCRTISRYFRCSRFGFRRGFKLSVFTLLLNAPRAAAMRAFLAIKEIKRRRRAALRGDPYNAHEPSVERPLSCEAPESLERGQGLSSAVEARKGPEVAINLSRQQTPSVNSGIVFTPETTVAPHAALMLAKQSGVVGGVSLPLESLGFSGTQLVAFGGVAAPGSELGLANPAAAASSNALIPTSVKSVHNPDASIVRGNFHMLVADRGVHKRSGSTLVTADGLKCDGSSTFTASPRADVSQHGALGVQHPMTGQFGAA